MKSAIDPRDKIEEVEMAPEHGYDAWKRPKIGRGLVQGKDRDAMIPVEQILRDFEA